MGSNHMLSYCTVPRGAIVIPSTVDSLVTIPVPVPVPASCQSVALLLQVVRPLPQGVCYSGLVLE
jgi:hypothetical protein